jgi:hypothetical protein
VLLLPEEDEVSPADDGEVRALALELLLRIPLLLLLLLLLLELIVLGGAAVDTGTV